MCLRVLLAATSWYSSEHRGVVREGRFSAGGGTEWKEATLAMSEGRGLREVEELNEIGQTSNRLRV